MNTFIIFLVLITIVCFLLIVIIMVQNPKGGGLSSTLGGSQMMGGVQKTTDFLDKATWALATILVVLVMLSSLSFTNQLEDNQKLIQSTEAAANQPAAAKEITAPAPSDTPAEQAPATETE